MPEIDLAVGPAHPFRAFWESGDLEVWVDALAPDVELHSPLITAPFRGRGAAAELYGVLFDRFDEFSGDRGAQFNHGRRFLTTKNAECTEKDKRLNKRRR